MNDGEPIIFNVKFRAIVRDVRGCDHDDGLETAIVQLYNELGLDFPTKLQIQKAKKRFGWRVEPVFEGYNE